MNPTNPIFYPNVSRVPSTPGVSEGQRPKGEEQIKPGEFDESLNQALKKGNLQEQASVLNPLNHGIKFSAHAMQRLNERKINFDSDMMAKMNDAITKAHSKGVQDTLILTDKAALIVSVPNRTVITAMDRNQLSGNVFTNIDGAVII